MEQEEPNNTYTSGSGVPDWNDPFLDKPSNVIPSGLAPYYIKQRWGNPIVEEHINLDGIMIHDDRPSPHQDEVR